MSRPATAPDDPTPSRCFALVPCAGSGSRAGGAGPKQYAVLAGLPMVAHTLAALRAVRRLHATLVVLAPDDAGFDAALPGFAGERSWLARTGGRSRAESVAAGLAALRERGACDDDWVLVHDAARCLVRADAVDRLIDACADHPVGGLLALPLADTLKQGADGQVLATVDRDGKWAAQTPQMFRLALLETALVAAGSEVTDESGAVEAAGHRPLLVRGDLDNFKLTWPGDFALAERLLRCRDGGGGAEVRAFVPARNFALSQRFYRDLGFQPEFSHDDLAGFTMGGSAFFLQNFFVAEHAANFMMYLDLDDLDAFWRRIDGDGLAARYGVRCEPPAPRPWGRIDMTLTDPSGVLWRIAQRPGGAVR